MECKNCKNKVPDSTVVCQWCGAYIEGKAVIDGQLKVQIRINDAESLAFNFNDDNKITVGRKDFHTNPDIDLGPYDSKRVVSRQSGFFILKNNFLYYIDSGKNQTFLNGTLLDKQKAYAIKSPSVLKIAGLLIDVTL